MNSTDIELPNQKPPKIARVFKSVIGTCSFPFLNGKMAHFINGKYLTDNKQEIQWLEDEVNSEPPHPHIFIDPNEIEININADPLEAIKKKAIAEYLAAQAKSQNNATADPNRNMGDSTNGKGGEGTGIANSQTNASVAAGSTSGGMSPNGARITTVVRK